MNSYYFLDAQNVITRTGGDWDEFSKQNGGRSDISQYALGTWLWDHIGDDDTCSYLNAVFFAARSSGSRVSLLYRCDTPAEPLQSRMNIIPREDQTLVVLHEQVPLLRQVGPGLVLSAGKAQGTKCCTVCRSHEVDGRWIDKFDHPSADFSIDHFTVCPECKSVAAQMLGDITPILEEVELA